MMFYGLLAISVFFCAILFLLRARKRPKKLTIGFFHPYADAGGGGERVLWHSVSAILEKWPAVHVVVICGEKTNRTPDRILQKVALRFGLVQLQQGTRIKFAYLRLRFLIEATTWPRFTLLGQCFGSMLLGLEAIIRHRPPHLLVDTMGYAFTYPLYRWLAGCPVAAYVHYPIVSTDMLAAVAAGRSAFNNSPAISRSRLLTSLKFHYYRFVAILYCFAGRQADVVMVNGTWTYGHISKLWRLERTSIVYPPCDVETFSQLADHKRDKEHFRIVSIGQFRPEKNQQMQLEVMKELLRRFPESKPLLIMIGSCRDEGDHKRVEELRHMAVKLKVDANVQFVVNVTFDQLLYELEQASAAIHTMYNEHFGISLVECMAAKCIMVAHRSGGPKLDIVVDKETGYLADSTEEFGDCIGEIINMSCEEREEMTRKAAESVRERFSIDTFEKRVIDELEPIVKIHVK